MTEPLTHQLIETGLQDAILRQENLTDDLALAGDEKAEKEVRYELARAKARTKIRGDSETKKSVDVVNDEALIATQQEFQEYLAAVSLYDATKQALMTVRVRIDALRSLLASYRMAGG